MNARPGFCIQCRAPIDPDDDRDECPACTDDLIDLDEPLDETLPGFNWRRRYCGESRRARNARLRRNAHARRTARHTPQQPPRKNHLR